MDTNGKGTEVVKGTNGSLNWNGFLKHKMLVMAIICAVITFVCITINSKNSFLYKLQDCDDAQCFMTVARCMLRGDVLYKDVYEHKGIVLYSLYLIANLIDNSSFIGVYYIELIAFFVFVIFTVKTLRLFCKSDFPNYCFAALIAIRTTSVFEFRAGGQCEEFALPLFAISIFLAFLIIRSLKEKDLSAYSIVIGICFAIVFWMKYTLTGLYIGFALSILIIGIKNKNIKFIVKNGLFFLLGAAIGSMPVLIYFAANNALPDLWEVYFYTMIFKYGKKRSIGALKAAKHIFAMLKKPYITIPIITWIAAPKKKLKIEEKVLGLLIAVFLILGCAFGALQLYTYECLHAIVVLGYIGVICFAQYFTAPETVENIREKEKKSRVDIIIIKLDEDIKNWKAEWENNLRPRFSSFRFSMATIAGGLFLVFFLVWFPSPFRVYMGYELDDYPLYQMKELIEERVPSNPQILYFDCTDMGLFNLTDTYPMDTFFCAYTLYTPDDLDYYNKYIINGEADFVVSIIPQHQLEDDYGFELIYDAEHVPFVSDSEYWYYYMYARGDLGKGKKIFNKPHAY